MAANGPARRMGRPPLEDVGEGERRAQILQAAGRLFAQRGYAAVSVGEIAAEVGVTKAALYHHFPGKDELFTESICATLTAIASAIRRVVELPISTRRQIALLSRIAIMEVQADADMDSMMRDVAEHLTTSQQERVGAAHRSMEDAYTALMQVGIARGELRAYEPRLLAHAYQHLLAAFAGRVGGEAGYQGRLETVDTVVELFMHGAGSAGKAPDSAPA